ncbi:MAG: hypothetical protein WBQ36_16235 [Desulfobaccales bacterium]
MLSEAKHLVFRDSSVACGSLRMTKKINAHQILVLEQTALPLNFPLENAVPWFPSSSLGTHFFMPGSAWQGL